VHWCFERSVTIFYACTSHCYHLLACTDKKVMYEIAYTGMTMAETALSMWFGRQTIHTHTCSWQPAAKGLYPFKTRMVPVRWMYCPETVYLECVPSVTVKNMADVLHYNLLEVDIAQSWWATWLFKEKKQHWSYLYLLFNKRILR
jgi:hypothetical protein